MSGVFQPDVFQPDVFQEANDHSGSGTMPLVSTLVGAGLKSGIGSGVLSDPVALAGAGFGGRDGSGSIALVASLTGAGAKQGFGSGSLTDPPVLVGAGEQKNEGVGSLTLVAVLAAAGEKAGLGAGALSAVAALDGAGEKEASGQGVMALHAVMSATGTASQPAEEVHHGGRNIVIKRRRSGRAVMDLEAELRGTGRVGRSEAGRLRLVPKMTAEGEAFDTDEAFLVALLDLAA